MLYLVIACLVQNLVTLHPQWLQLGLLGGDTLLQLGALGTLVSSSGTNMVSNRAGATKWQR